MNKSGIKLNKKKGENSPENLYYCRKGMHVQWVFWGSSCQCQVDAGQALKHDVRSLGYAMPLRQCQIRSQNYYRHAHWTCNLYGGIDKVQQQMGIVWPTTWQLKLCTRCKRDFVSVYYYLFFYNYCFQNVSTTVIDWEWNKAKSTDTFF